MNYKAPVLALCLLFALGACDEEESKDKTAPETTKAEQAHPENLSHDEERCYPGRVDKKDASYCRALILKNVSIPLVTKAYDDPAIRQALETAKTQTNDNLPDGYFLKMEFEVAASEGVTQHVTAVAFCRSASEKPFASYSRECGEAVRVLIAATNHSYKDGLANHVPTDSPAVRSNALSSLAGLRGAASRGADSGYLVRRINSSPD